jgi:hypothetical protein
LKILNHQKEQIQNGSNLLLDIILVTRSLRQRLKTRVPTQITCQTFKEHPAALRAWGKGPGSIARSHIPSTEMTGPHTYHPSRIAAGAARGAQYSPD